MLSLKLVRSLVLGDTINTSPLSNHSITNQTTPNNKKTKLPNPINNNHTSTPLLLFLPTKELITDTYRLATIARDMGMDLNPTPSLSHIIFSWPSPSTSSPLSSLPSLWSSSSSTWSLPSDSVPLPFPSLTTTSTTHLKSFVSLSKGLFKLVFYKSNNSKTTQLSTSNWDCSSLSLFCRVTGDRIDSMERFSRVLAGRGWSLFKTKDDPCLVSPNFSSNGPVSMYLFRKVDSSRLRSNNTNAASSGEFRIRELRLPCLDFRNAPLRILQYILLMTDNVFYLA